MDKRKKSKRKLALLRQNLERRERKLREYREAQERGRRVKKIIFRLAAIGFIALTVVSLFYL